MNLTLLIICVFALVVFYLARPLIKSLIEAANNDLPKTDNNQVNYNESSVSSSKKKKQTNTDIVMAITDLQKYKERQELFDRIQNLCVYIAYESFQAAEIESRQSLSGGSKIAAGCKLKVILKDDKTFNILMEVNESRPVGELGYRSTFWLSSEEFKKHFRI